MAVSTTNRIIGLWGVDMELLLFMAGALLGFIFGGIFGRCQMDNLHQRVKGDSWRGDIPRSRKKPPLPEYNPHK